MILSDMLQFSIVTAMIQLAMIVCVIVYVTLFLLGIRRGKVRPVLATWLFFSLATLLSFLTNFAQNGVSGILANSFNITDTVGVWTIFFVVVFHKDTRKQFTKFEKWCIGAVTVIFIGWLISGQNIAAHLSIQTILIIAYLPTLAHLWRSTKNTETLGGWSFDSLASIFGIIEPLKTMALLPLVYGIRSIISTLT